VTVHARQAAPPCPPKELGPAKTLDPTRADAETENAADREPQEVIDQKIPPRA
jgi:hypothetical protein